MSSQRKSETARINGAKSRGPITEAGRETSSQNALKHGLTSGSAIVLACECQEDFDKIMDHFLSVYKPANAAEQDLVEEMVAARWRIRRLWTIETSLIDTEILKQNSISTTPNPGAKIGGAFRALSDESRSMALASRYESRLHRIYDHAYATLRELQQSRPPVPEPVVPETKALETKAPEAEVTAAANVESERMKSDPTSSIQNPTSAPSNIRSFPSPKKELQNEPTDSQQLTAAGQQPTPPAYNK
jgi:hypothetical protein